MITEVMSMSMMLWSLSVFSACLHICSPWWTGRKGDWMTCCLTEWSLMKGRITVRPHISHRNKQTNKKQPLFIPGWLAPRWRVLAHCTSRFTSASKCAAAHRRVKWGVQISHSDFYQPPFSHCNREAPIHCGSSSLGRKTLFLFKSPSHLCKNYMTVHSVTDGTANMLMLLICSYYLWLVCFVLL